MYMKNSKNYQDLMSGKIVELTQYELWNILCHQNELNINTIAIQKTIDGNFMCFVDSSTIRTYNSNLTFS